MVLFPRQVHLQKDGGAAEGVSFQQMGHEGVAIQAAKTRVVNAKRKKRTKLRCMML